MAIWVPACSVCCLPIGQWNCAATRTALVWLRLWAGSGQREFFFLLPFFLPTKNRLNRMPFPDKITEWCARRFNAIHYIRCRCHRRRHIHRIVPVIKPFYSFSLSANSFLNRNFSKVIISRSGRIQCNVTNDLLRKFIQMKKDKTRSNKCIWKIRYFCDYKLIVRNSRKKHCLHFSFTMVWVVWTANSTWNCRFSPRRKHNNRYFSFA